ncbi:MAG: hypothetical protein MK101_02545 [Phycisphaerales bacterium]|nr:hypothetical protein [Phycisphaerales bacterium]
MPMPLATISIGILLVLQGLGFYFASDAGSWTPAIPAIPGAIFVLLGFLSLIAPPLRKHLMHLVMLLALLAAIAALMRGLPALGADPAPADKIAELTSEGALTDAQATAKLASIHWAKVWDQLLMGGLCLLLLGMGIGSFMQARRSGATGKADQP